MRHYASSAEPDERSRGALRHDGTLAEVPKPHSQMRPPVGCFGPRRNPEASNRSQEPPPVRRGRHIMVESGTVTFNDPDGYAAAFGDTRVELTISGAGDFAAQLTQLNLQHLDVYRCRESLARIAYISFPAERIMLSFPAGTSSPMFGGLALRDGDILFHRRGEHLHQRSNGACEWGLISLSSKQLADCSEALIGRRITSPHASRILRPARSSAYRFARLFREACRLAEAGLEIVGRAEVARTLGQELLHAIVHCLDCHNDSETTAIGRRHHAAVMVRFEQALTDHADKKLNLPTLCADIDVAERTLRLCCAEVLGVSPTRYLLLQRLNRARAALRRANPSTATVAEVARNNQFLELGRFAVTYRTVFGESPSITLQRPSWKS